MSTMVTFGGGISDFSLRSDEEKYPIWDKNAMWTAWVLLEDGTFERLTDLVNVQGEPYEGDVLRANRFGRIPEVSGWSTTLSDIPEYAYVQRVGSTEQRLRIRTINGTSGGGGGGGGTSTSGGRTLLRFEFEEPWGTGSVQGGIQDIPERYRITGPVILRAEPDPAANAVSVNLRKRPTGGSETDLYLSSRPTLPAGANRAVTIEPDIDSIEDGELWPVLVNQPLSSEASAMAASIVAKSTFNSGATVATSYTVPVPIEAQLGDLILFIGSMMAPDLNLPAAFTRHINRASTDGVSATPHSRTMVWSAPWTTGMASIAVGVNPYTPASGGTPIATTPLIATVFVIRNGATAAPTGWQASSTAGNTSGPAIVTPDSGGSANGADADLTFFVGSARYNSGMAGWSSTISGAGATEQVDVTSTRATQTNCSQHVYTAGAVTAADPIAARTITLAGGNGDGMTISQTAAAFTIRRGAGRPSPTRIVVTVPVESVPVTA